MFFINIFFKYYFKLITSCELRFFVLKNQSFCHCITYVLKDLLQIFEKVIQFDYKIKKILKIKFTEVSKYKAVIPDFFYSKKVHE